MEGLESQILSSFIMYGTNPMQVVTKKIGAIMNQGETFGFMTGCGDNSWLSPNNLILSSGFFISTEVFTTL